MTWQGPQFKPPNIFPQMCFQPFLLLTSLAEFRVVALHRCFTKCLPNNTPTTSTLQNMLLRHDIQTLVQAQQLTGILLKPVLRNPEARLRILYLELWFRNHTMNHPVKHPYILWCSLLAQPTSVRTNLGRMHVHGL